MKLEDYNNFYHVDISGQIEKWKNDTVHAIVKNSKRCSVKIKAKDKKHLKERFISNDKSYPATKHNKKVVTIIYSYLLYKALCEFPGANPLLLCRDVRPERLVFYYFHKIAKYYNNLHIFNRIIKFRKRIEFGTKEKLPKSLAGKYAKKVYQGKIPTTKILDNSEINKLIEIISKVL